MRDRKALSKQENLFVRKSNRIILMLVLILLVQLWPVMTSATEEGVELEDTYALVASTGATPGEKVQYFAVNYRDTAGILRREYSFPH